MKSLSAIAAEINATAPLYKMGQFQEIRRKIRGLSRPKTREIFSAQTIHQDWAFHSGGRSEIQFNIGFEGERGELVRYGLAFSLEPSRTLPDPLILKPKILKLNSYIQRNQAELEDLRFWYYHRDNNPPKSPALPMLPVSEELIRKGAFLFFGKTSRRETIRPQPILFLFDRLLDIYQYVEGDTPLARHPAGLKKGFLFKPGCPEKPDATVGRSRAATRAIALRHNKLQKALHAILSRQYGATNVGTENDTGRGSRVDLVVRNRKKHCYYEIKVSQSIRACLREAMAQLIEYSYWPGGNEAEQLIVISENPMTPDARRYMRILREQFDLPIFYQRLDLKRDSLGAKE